MLRKRRLIWDEANRGWLVPLSKNCVGLVSDEDYAWVSNYNWCMLTESHAGGWVSGRRVFLHSEIARRLGWIFEPGMEIDHINGNSVDNRRENLRLCSKAQNIQNRSRKRTTTLPKGVSFHKLTGKWQGRVQCNKQRTGRLFDDIKTAEIWVRAKREELHGEYARHE